jgi:hypothetical protein
VDVTEFYGEDPKTGTGMSVVIYGESHMDRSACGTGLGLAIGFHLFYKPTVKFAGNSVSCEGLSLMKITRCIYWTEDLKLSRPYTTVNSVENIFVQLELEEGSALKIMRSVE